MADPLSITASVVTLIQVSVQVTLLLKQFRDEASSIDNTLNGILTDVEGFQQVLESMKETFEEDEIKATLQTTGHVGNHWKNLARSLNDGKATLRRLHELLDSVNKSRSFLDAPRKALRLKGVSDQIGTYRDQIQSYRSALQLSLSTVILWNQVTFQKSTEKIPEMILSSLDSLYDEFRELGITLSARIEKLQATVRDTNQQEELDAMGNLRECVRAAVDVASSASTTLTTEFSDDILVRHGSDFGDIFPSLVTQTVVQWIESNTIYEFDHPETQPLPIDSSPREIANDYSSDSDSDIERDLIQALFETGLRRETEDDLKGALRCYKNCLSRIPPYPGAPALLHDSSERVSRLEVLEAILRIHTAEISWTSAKPVIIEMLQIIQRQKGTRNTEYLKANLTLARILFSCNEVIEAHLQARKTLRGFKKLGETSDIKYKETLEFLIDICRTEGNDTEEEAYVALLENHEVWLEQKSVLAGDESQGPRATRTPSSEATFFTKPTDQLARRSEKSHGHTKQAEYNDPNHHVPSASLLTGPINPRSTPEQSEDDMDMSVRTTSAFSATLSIPKTGRTLGPEHKKLSSGDSGSSRARQAQTYAGGASDITQVQRAQLPSACADNTIQRELSEDFNACSNSENENPCSAAESPVAPTLQSAGTQRDVARATSSGESSSNKDFEWAIDNHGDYILDEWGDPIALRNSEVVALRSALLLSDEEAPGSDVDQSNIEEGKESVQERIFPFPPKKDSIARLSTFPNSEFTKSLLATPTMPPENIGEADELNPDIILDMLHNGALLPRSMLHDCPGCRMNLERLSEVAARNHIQRCMETTRNFYDPAMRVRSDIKVAARRKILLLGDSMCGKTWLAMSWAMGRPLRSSLDCLEPLAFNNFTKDISIDGLRIELFVRDSSGEEGFEDIRQLSYKDTDVVLLCFDVNQNESLNRLQQIWNSNANTNLRNVPKVIVGCKADLLGDRRRSYPAADRSRFAQLSRSEWRQPFDAVAYYETSAVSKVGVTNLFENTARIALGQEVPERKTPLQKLYEIFSKPTRQIMKS